MRQIFLGLVAALAMSAESVGAQETRVGEEGFESPPASVDQLDWLVGQWAGEGIRGAPAMESWLPPSGGTMVGTFVQETQDGAIMFTEHLYIMPVGDSLALKLKHFNADLTGWEEKDDMLTFRLVAIEPCAAYFNALTLRCADPHNPGAGLVAAVRMRSDKPEPVELTFRFDRVDRSQPAAHSDADCADTTTRGYAECFAARGQSLRKRHDTYLAAAIERYKDDEVVVEAIEESVAAFDAYLQKECSAVYASFDMGTIRTAESILCSNDLLQRRTHTIWRNWLTYADNSPPILPKPLPAR